MDYPKLNSFGSLELQLIFISVLFKLKLVHRFCCITGPKPDNEAHDQELESDAFGHQAQCGSK